MGAALSPMPEGEHEDESDDHGVFTDPTTQERDSGICHSDPELPPPLSTPSSPESESRFNCATVTASPSDSKFLGSIQTPTSPGSQLISWDNTRCSDGSIGDELTMLHNEMETIKVQCDKLIATHASAELRVRQQVAKAHNLIAAMDSLSMQNTVKNRKAPLISTERKIVESPKFEIKITPGVVKNVRPAGAEATREETSSAYNTGGDSCRSTPHTLRSVIGQTVYTDPAHLHHTIQLQQKQMKDAMLTKKVGQPVMRLAPIMDESCSRQDVKRRSDGSRYITRRPVRNRILRERAQQVSNERFGISTDDDAASELKGERKQQLEKSKERKLRQQELLKKKLQLQPADQQIIQLAHKKLSRRKGQQLMDRFTTLQEYLAHGSRDASVTLGILSVTTV